MFNKIILAGNLTRDIELRYTQGGSAIANTAIATSRKFTQNGEKKEDVCFVDVTFFGRSAEIANQYLHKGSKILIEGRLKFDQWQDQNGNNRSKHSVTVESMQMLDSKNGNSDNSQSQSNNGQTNQTPQQGNYRQYQPPQQQNYQTNQPPVYYEDKNGKPIPPQQNQQHGYPQR